MSQHRTQVLAPHQQDGIFLHINSEQFTAALPFASRSSCLDLGQVTRSPLCLTFCEPPQLHSSKL